MDITKKLKLFGKVLKLYKLSTKIIVIYEFVISGII